MITLIRLITIVLLSATFSLCAGQRSYTRIDGSTVHTDRLDSHLRSILDSGNVTGASIAIIQNNTIVHTFQHGVKSRSKKEAIDSSTIFYTASLTKPVFSFLVLKLADNGLIDLDTPLSGFGSTRKERITPRMILSHSSKGTYRYSNEHYSRLGSWVEHHLHNKLETLAEEHVFRPVKMNRTSFTWKDSFDENYAVGHNNKGQETGIVKSVNAGAAASILSTANDYARFLILLNQRNSLSRKLRRAMFTPQVKANTVRAWGSSDTVASEKSSFSWGLGLGILETKQGRAYWHAGHFDGWRNYFILYPRKRTGIVIMSNSENLEKVAKQILYETIGDLDSPMEWIRWE